MGSGNIQGPNQESIVRVQKLPPLPYLPSPRLAHPVQERCRHGQDDNTAHHVDNLRGEEELRDDVGRRGREHDEPLEPVLPHLFVFNVCLFSFVCLWVYGICFCVLCFVFCVL